MGTARWRGTPLRALLAEPGVTDDAVEVVFTGLDHGLEGGIEQAYQRSLSLIDTDRPEVLPGVRDERCAPRSSARLPAALLVPGWYGMTSVKWLGRITAVDCPLRGVSAVPLLPAAPGRGRDRRATVADAAAGADGSARLPGVRDTQPHRARRAAPSRAGPGLASAKWRRSRCPTDGGDRLGRRRRRGRPRSPWAWRRWTFEWTPGAGEHELCCRARDAAGTSSRWSRRGTSAAT